MGLFFGTEEVMNFFHKLDINGDDVLDPNRIVLSLKNWDFLKELEIF